MPNGRMRATGPAPAWLAGHGAAAAPLPLAGRCASAGRIPRLATFAASLALAGGWSAALSGCGTLTETTEQYVMVQTVLDHQQVAGIGCVLSNDVGRWFVTSPGRVQIRKSAKPLVVDCRQNDVWVVDEIGPKQNASRWGNILLTAGAGQFIDRQTGAGFDYPTTLTVLLKRVAPAQPAVPPEARAPSQPAGEPAPASAATPSPAPQAPQAPAEPGGSIIY